MGTNSKIKIMQPNLAAIAWQEYIRENMVWWEDLDNDIIHSALVNLGCQVDIDWNNPHEQKKLYATFEDGSILYLKEDRNGNYNFRKIIEPDEMPENYLAMATALEGKISASQGKNNDAGWGCLIVPGITILVLWIVGIVLGY